MKNTVLTFLSILLVFTFTSCKDGKITDSNSSTIVTNDSTLDSEKIEDPSKNKLKTLQLGEHQLNYESNYEFVYDDIFTQNLKATQPLIVDAKYYNFSMPRDRAIIGLNYSSYETNVNVDGAIDGILGRYENIPGVVLSNQKIEDVSNNYGVTAKIGSGNIVFSTQSAVGEYRFLILSNENEMIMIQGLFEHVGLKSAEEFLTLLKSIKL